MRIALVAPLVTVLRASQAGGSQAVVCDLAAGLLAAGDEVIVLAARGSRVPGVPIRTLRLGPYPGGLLDLGSVGRARAAARGPGEGTRAPLRARRPAATPPSVERPWPPLQAAAHLEAVATARAWGADVLHVHAHDWPAVYAAAASGLPTVHTLHLPPEDPAVAGALRAAERLRPRPVVVAVSRACAAQWRGVARVDGVVPNGADPDAVGFVARPVPDLAVVPGRVAPEKGTHLAVSAALRAGMRVVVAGPVYDAVYMKDHVAPLVDGRRVTTTGALPRDRLGRLLGRAAVVVLGTQWEEPFGMVALEANLAGTPVAAPRRGGLPEALGASGGVLVDGVDATGPRRAVETLAAAVTAARQLDRRRVRAAAARRRPLARTVARYRAIYRDAVEAGR